MLVISACGGEDPPSPQSAGEGSSPAALTPGSPHTSTPTPATTATTTPGTVITTAGSEFGEILFDGAGQAIYLFDKEETSEPECYDACAEEWPPVLTDGDPLGEAQAASDLLATTQRTDGTTQVTYAGQPLYYYAHEGTGEVKCHNIREFGGLWLVVTPSGDPAP
jgi:predicted lipoprotein with Yx(FWY)xxD motif